MEGTVGVNDAVKVSICLKVKVFLLLFALAGQSSIFDTPRKVTLISWFLQHLPRRPFPIKGSQ